MSLTSTILAVTLILGALFEEAPLLQSSAHAAPHEDHDFLESAGSASLPQTSPVPRRVSVPLQVSVSPQTSMLPHVAGTKFISRGKNGGRWRGRVFGSGPTTLILRFFRGEALVKRKLVGRVKLDNEPEGVRFSYSGSRPRAKTTHWDIIAIYDKSK